MGLIKGDTTSLDYSSPELVRSRGASRGGR